MLNVTTDNQSNEEPLANLRLRAEQLERELSDARLQAERQVIAANLRVEAIRAGMIDLDGIKLLDHSLVKLGDDGQIAGGSELMRRLRQDKPWLFGGSSSSHPAGAPPAQAPRQKLAIDMTDEEYRAARAQLLKRTA